MMVVYMQIAGGLDLQIEESMAREALEHVIEERHPGLASPRPPPSSLSETATLVSRVLRST